MHPEPTSHASTRTLHGNGDDPLPLTHADRRGEAHLWLVLEEALAAARAGGDERSTREAQRVFGSVADALVVVGAIDMQRATALVVELDDALAVRGLARPSRFSGRVFPHWQPETHPARRMRGDGWLEAEIEHHLDLVVDLDPMGGRFVARRVLDVLEPPVRALKAVGALPHGPARLADLAATFRAAGYPIEVPHGEPDHGWLGFLRGRPALLSDKVEPVATAEVDLVVGGAGDEPVRVRRIGWSEHLLELRVAGPGDAAQSEYRPWRCSVFDDAGRLHLGQAGTPTDGLKVFRLRPGLMAGVKSMSIRITRGAERMEEHLWL